MGRISGRAVLKVPLIGLGLIALGLGASLVLTDPDPATLPRRARRWLAPVSWRSSSPPPVAPRPVPEETIRPYSDVTTVDDSGYSSAILFSKPIIDPASLAQIRDSVVGRGRRGIAHLERKLAGLLPGQPAT